MQKRGPFWVLLALVALIGAVSAPRAPGPRAERAPDKPAGPEGASHPAPAPAPAPSAAQEWSAYGVLATHFEDLMVKATGYSPAASARDPSTRTLDIAATYREQGRELEAIVVSAPDPRQSHLALYYGQMLESLRRAFASVGFVQDRFWLEDLEPRASSADGPAPRPDAKDGEAGQAPGLILFRRRTGSDESLFVAVLIAESPVVGADVAQVEAALTFAHDIAPGRPLKVLGPAFSGSAHSLADALRRFHAARGGARAAVQIVTGSATGSEVCKTLSPAGADHVTFRSTVVPDDAVEGWLLDALAPRDGVVPIVAALRELGTGYGAGSLPIEPAGAAPPERAARCRRPASSREIPVYQFPLHIAEVRADHERAEGPHEDAFPTLRRTLGLKFDPAEEHEPDLPATHSQLTPYEDDLSLAQTLAMIRDRGVQFLLIEATDPVDAVFLVQELRRYAPNVTPVLVEHDQMFVHPDLGSTFAGALVASTYAPSFVLSEAFDDARDGHLAPFANLVGQGAFNAALTLLDGSGIVPNAMQERRGYSCEKAGGKEICGLQVFVSQISGSVYWPLAAAIDPDPSEDPAHVAKGGCPSTRRMPSDRAARVFAWFALFAALWHLVGRFSKLSSWTSALGASILARGWGPSRRVRGLWTAVAGVSLAAVLALTALPFAIELQEGCAFAPLSGNRFAAAALTACLGGVFACVALGDAVGGAMRWLGRSHAAERAPRPAPAVEWALLAFWVVPSALAVVWAVETFLHPQETIFERPREPLHLLAGSCRLFPLYRLLAPLTMSTATPLFLLCVGFYLRALAALCRIDRLDRFPGWLPLPEHPRPTRHAGDHGPTRDRAGCEAVRLRLEDCWSALYTPWRRTHAWLAALPAAFAIWRFYVHFKGTFEGPLYDFSFSISLIALGLVVASAVVRFLALGRSLLALLRELASEPMVDAYERISQKVAGSFGLQLSARVPAAGDLAVSVLLCRRLASFGRGEKERALQAEACRVESAFAELAPDGATGGRFTAPAFAGRDAAVHAALLRAAAVLHEILGAMWRERATAPDAEQTAKDFPGDQILPGGPRAGTSTVALFLGGLPPEEYLWLRAAEDFVALRYSTFVYQVLHELRFVLVQTLTAAFVAVLSVGAYPFRPAHFLTIVGWSVVVAVVAAALQRIVAFERDEVLSRLGGTTPNQIEWNANFIQQIVVFGALPLAAALVGIFPDLADSLARVLTSLTRVASLGT